MLPLPQPYRKKRKWTFRRQVSWVRVIFVYGVLVVIFWILFHFSLQEHDEDELLSDRWNLGRDKEDLVFPERYPHEVKRDTSKEEIEAWEKKKLNDQWKKVQPKHDNIKRLSNPSVENWKKRYENKEFFTDDGLTLEDKRLRVQKSFLEAWTAYQKTSFGHDEIRPETNVSHDSWGGFGVSLIDSLDTLWIMRFDDQFELAKEFVATLNFKQDVSVSFFETTIRHLGGLLGAYDLSKDLIFLQKAQELADQLMPAFNSPTGLPYHECNLLTGKCKNPHWTNEQSILSEVGSIQLEWKYLSQATGNPIYAEKVERIYHFLYKQNRKYKGLYPLFLDIETGNFSSGHISVGGLGDSFYEYQLKMFLLTKKSEPFYKTMYTDFVDDLQKHLVQRSQPNNYVYLSELNGNEVVDKFEHLACFVPGLLALGSIELEDRQSDMILATQLMNTCVNLYTDQPSGIAPDTVMFNREPRKPKDYSVVNPEYLLRPETVESLFILHRVTGSEIWQKMGWVIFKAIEKHCRMNSGAYSGVKDVTKQNPLPNDSMQSFFLSETLKYLYLLFSPNEINLSEIVFTTEAHILSRFDAFDSKRSSQQNDPFENPPESDIFQNIKPVQPRRYRAPKLIIPKTKKAH